jgi:hypothetical protein
MKGAAMRHFMRPSLIALAAAICAAFVGGGKVWGP